MTGLRRILAATDFSPRAEVAIDRAALLAKQHGAALELLHVVGRLYLELIRRLATDDPLVTEQQLVDSAGAQLVTAAARLAREHGIEVDSHVTVGTAHAAVAENAAALGCDLTVLGAHGENVVLDLVPGTTAQKAVRQGAGAFLIVKREPAGAYARILVPVDFSDDSLQGLLWARRIAPEAGIRTLHAYEVPFESRMRLAGVGDEAVRQFRERALRDAQAELAGFVGPAEGAASRALPLVRRGYPPATILEAARELDADLIAMGASGRSGLSRWLLGSVTSHVLAEAGCDVLIVKHGDSGQDAAGGR